MDFKPNNGFNKNLTKILIFSKFRPPIYVSLKKGAKKIKHLTSLNCSQIQNTVTLY